MTRGRDRSRVSGGLKRARETDPLSEATSVNRGERHQRAAIRIFRRFLVRFRRNLHRLTRMASKTGRHPYSYTLDLLALAIAHLPPTFSDARREQYKKRLQYYRRHPESAYAEIQHTIAELGKESWPFRKAYEDMYVAYGRSSEESFLLDNLDRGIREKYEAFIHEGGKINHIENAKSADDLRKVSPFERYFSPEEKFAIEQALFAARHAARKEIDDLVLGKKNGEYKKLVKDYVNKQWRLENKLNELRQMADVSEKWQPMVMDRVRTLEEGWSVVERGINEDLLDKELEFWQGTLASFLHA